MRGRGAGFGGDATPEAHSRQYESPAAGPSPDRRWLGRVLLSGMSCQQWHDFWKVRALSGFSMLVNFSEGY
jgi:hypothetical protein